MTATIRFAGICTFVDPAGGDRYSKVILPNAERGQQGVRAIPAHLAFINARRDEVEFNLNEWEGHSLATLTEVLLFLKGVNIRFSTTPEGSPTAMRKLPRVRDICADSEELADGILMNPDPTKVAAIAEVRNGASGVFEHRRAKSAFLEVPVRSRIIVQPFGTGAQRTIEIIKDGAEVVIGNVDLIGYLFGSGDPDDDHHSLLHCRSFRPRMARRAALRERRDLIRGDGRQPQFQPAPLVRTEQVFAQLLSEIKAEKPDRKARLAEKLIDFLKTSPDFRGRLDTLAAGCSNTTHP